MSEAPAEAAPEPMVEEPQAKVRWAFVLLTAVAGLGMLTAGYVATASSSAPGEIGSPIAQLFHQVGSFHYLLGVIALASSSLSYSIASRARLWGLVCAVAGAASLGSFLLIAAAGAPGVLVLGLPGLLGLAAGSWAASRGR